MSDPTVTPNVVIEDPVNRKRLNVIVSSLLILVGTAAAVDGATPAFDISAITVPASVGLLYVAAAFNLVVTLPNVPR